MIELEQYPGPTLTPKSVSESSLKGSSSINLLERPSHQEADSSTASIALDTDSPSSNDGVDQLLNYYQGFLPPHVRVYKREHPHRYHDETDDNYEFRCLIFEYAKLHPLVPKSYFFDIDIKDELLVPIEQSSSSEDSFVLSNEEELPPDRQCEDEIPSNIDTAPDMAQEDDDKDLLSDNGNNNDMPEATWKAEEIPQCMPKPKSTSRNNVLAEAARELQELLASHSSDESIESYRGPSTPEVVNTTVILPGREVDSGTSAKSVSFADPIGALGRSQKETGSGRRPPSTKSFSSLKSSRSSRSQMSLSDASWVSATEPFKLTNFRPTSAVSLPRVLEYHRTDPVFQKSMLPYFVPGRRFEEKFLRPDNRPAKSKFSCVHERRQLIEKYTFIKRAPAQDRKLGESTAGSQYFSPNRLHSGTPPPVKVTERELIVKGKDSSSTNNNYKKFKRATFKIPSLKKAFTKLNTKLSSNRQS